MLTPRLLHPRAHRRSAAPHAALRSTAPGAHATSARASLTLALLALGLIEVAAGLGRPWRWLVEALLLAVLALGFLVAAQRSHGRRFAWLLSGSIAAGLALAASYNLIAATATPAVPVAGVAIFVAIMLLLMHRIVRQPPRR